MDFEPPKGDIYLFVLTISGFLGWKEVKVSPKDFLPFLDFAIDLDWLLDLLLFTSTKFRFFLKLSSLYLGWLLLFICLYFLRSLFYPVLYLIPYIADLFIISLFLQEISSLKLSKGWIYGI